MYKHLLAFVGSMALLGALHVFLDQEHVAELWLVHIFEMDRHLAHGELLHYAVLLILGLPAAALLCHAWPAPLWQRACGLLERGGFLLPAFVATVVAFCISRWVTHGAWFTDDEQAYLFQMKTYRQLALTVQASPLEAALYKHTFLIQSKTVDGVQHWSGVYPFMQPALMTLSSFLGSPLLSQWLCAGLIAFNTGHLAERLSDDRNAGIIAAWMCATSPMLVGLAATYHTAVLGTLLSVLAVRALLAARDTPTLLHGVAAGACAGAAFLTRGLEGTLVVLVVGGGLSLRARRDLRACLPMLAGYAAAGLVALTLYLLFNYGVTGDWLKTGYAMWGAQRGDIMGFGKQMMWGRTHTPEHGVAQTITTLVRMNSWLFGWPISLLLPLAALFKPFRARAAVYLVAFSAVQLSGYFFLAFGSVHDFGAAYHVWHVPWMACLMALLIHGVRKYELPTGRMVSGLVVVGLLAFWPTQLTKWRGVADLILGPVRAAEEAAGGRPAVVLWRGVKIRGQYSWVHEAPASFPDDSIVWLRDSARAVELARRIAPERDIYRLDVSDGQPRVVLVEKP